MAKGKYHKWLTAEGLTLIGGWARQGLSEEQIAHNMGIRRQTLDTYKNRFAVIKDTLKKNKEVIDLEVENALLKRALGYEYEEQRETEGEDGKTYFTKIIKEAAPDPTSIIFWLKNRRPDLWRDKHEVQHSGNVGLTLEDHLKGVQDGEEY